MQAENNYVMLSVMQGKNYMIALDASARTYDANGRLHISKTHITKATVNPYYGREIPGWEALGLDPNRIYRLFRCPRELEKAAPTFERIQILIRHKPILDTDPPKDITVGAIGSDVAFSFPYLDADVCVWDRQAIAGIETKVQREWSCAYRYVPVMTPGEFEGQPYDGVMTQIQADHLAIVEDGRAGSDVVAADEALKPMKTTKLGKALIVTLGGLSPKLAQDSALVALVGLSTAATFNKADVSAKLIGMDSELKPERFEPVIDSLLAMDADAEEKPEPKTAEDSDEDEDPEPKTAEDEDEDEEEERKKKVAQDAALQVAMDSFKRELREADEARRAVRSVVGEVIAQDSAADIYGFALDHMKVAHTGVTELPALKALFSLANSTRIAQDSTPAPRIAQDSAGITFPGATRFRQQ